MQRSLLSLVCLGSACAPVPDLDESPPTAPAAHEEPAPEPAVVMPADAPPRRAGIGCVAAAFPESKGPPDDGATMSQSATPKRFGPITCAAGQEIWHDAKGRMQVCTIAKRVRTHGVDLAADNYTHFHSNGAPYQTTLARPHTLRTVDGVAVECAADFVVLDAGGKVSHCTLAHDTKLGVSECKGGEDVAFRDSGALWSCTIAEPVAALDQKLPAGTRMSWHEGGEVASVYTTNELVVGGMRVNFEIEVHPNGQLAHATLAEPRTIGGLALESFAKVWFYADGSPWHVEYVAEHGFMVHGEPWTDTRRVTFDCAGKIVADYTEHFQAPTGPHGERP